MLTYLGLGSNMGQKLDYLRFAIEQLNLQKGLQLMAKSSIYSSSPWGYADQDSFYNAVLCYKSSLNPQQLLAICQAIELEAGRERLIKWGPRVLDIDILLFDNLQIEEPNLIIPHPYLEQRLFVLQPLAEIAPQLILPNSYRISDLIDSYQGDEQITVINEHW